VNNKLIERYCINIFYGVDKMTFCALYFLLMFLKQYLCLLGMLSVVYLVIKLFEAWPIVLVGNSALLAVLCDKWILVLTRTLLLQLGAAPE